MARSSYKFTSRPERTLRALRQSAGTVYHQLLAQGFTAEDIASESERGAGLRRISLVLAPQDGATLPLVGVAYGGDFRTEEEVGVPKIAKALREGDHDGRTLTGEVDGHWFMGLRADIGREDWDADYVAARASSALERARHTAEWDAGYEERHMSAVELRHALRAAGATGPLPRKKEELRALHASTRKERPEYVSVGEFHYGDILILLPAAPALEATLRILAGSGKHLRMGGSSTPFGHGATLFDERDLTCDAIEGQRAREDYVKRMNRKAEPTRKALSAHGHLFALSPRHRKDGQDLFWLNFSPRGHRQQSGMFTLSQIATNLANDTW